MIRNLFASLLFLTLSIILTAEFSLAAVTQPSGPMLEMVFIQLGSQAGVATLARMGIDIAAVRKPGTVKGQGPGFRVEAVVSAGDKKNLTEAGFTWTVPSPPSSSPALRTRLARKSGSVYHSFDEPGLGIQAQLEQIAEDYPRLAQLTTIGHSLNGRPLLAMRLTAGGVGAGPRRGFWNMARLDKPEVLFLATHHAREWPATQMAMRLIKYLVENFGKESRVSKLLLTTEIWIVPVANPDGYEYTFTNERLWRKNLRDIDANGMISASDGVDLNRNFDSHWGLDDEGSAPVTSDDNYRGTAPHSEPETLAVAEFVQAHDFKFAVSYHTFSNLILYAWNWQFATPGLDDPIFLAQSGTDENPAIRDSILDRGYDPGVGADLYTTNGDFTDWCYEKAGVPSYVVELTFGEDAEGNYYGFEFPDDERMVQAMFEDNLNFALSLAESAKDPAHPISPTGIVAEDIRHTPVATSWGTDQAIEVLARKELPLTLTYSIDGGALKTASFSTHLGAEYNDAPGVYYSNYRAVIGDQVEGDSISYTITAGDSTLGPYGYTVAVATGNPVLILSAEDYTGEDPEYEDSTGPNYLGYYTDALDAAGYGYDLYDLTEHAAAPSPIDVLSHYEVVIWYTGDDFRPSIPGEDLLQSQVLNLRDFMNYDGGSLLATGQDLQYMSVVDHAFSDDFFQYNLGAYMHIEKGGMDQDVGVPFPVRGAPGDPIFGGLSFNLHGDDSAGNQFYADSFLTTGYFLPHFDHAIAANYDRSGGPFEPYSGTYYVYSQMANMAYKRLGGTFTLPDGNPTLKFRVSFDLEADWDYSFVEINEVGTDTWTTLPDLNGLTTRETGGSCSAGWVDKLHPFLAHYIDGECNPVGTTGQWHAFNGNSGGWKQVEMDLSAYAGKTVEIHLSYASDWGGKKLGLFVDDVAVSGYPTEDFENGSGAFLSSAGPESAALNN